MPPKYKKVCPYCGKTCEAYYPKNLFCECGAKYYLKTDTWLERKKKKENPDLVEVVRCKDCKHNPENGGECDRSITHTGRDYVCEVNTYRYIGIDYCSFGERSENGKS